MKYKDMEIKKIDGLYKVEAFTNEMWFDNIEDAKRYVDKLEGTYYKPIEA